jgi:hypothetical protein
MTTRAEQDSERAYTFMHKKAHDIMRGELPFFESYSIVEVRDHFRWTRTRAQKAIDLLIEQGRVRWNGNTFNLYDPSKKENIYQIVSVDPVSESQG